MRDQSITEQSRIVPLDEDRALPWWRRNLVWLVPGAGLVVVLAMVAVVFSFWRTDQVAVRPGSVEEVPSRVTVSGAEIFPPTSEVSLVTVRIGERLTIWQRIWAEFESGVDVEPERSFTGDGTRRELRKLNERRMESSQDTAVVVALEHLGYEIPRGGVVVVEVASGTPAAEVLEPGDVIVGIEGVTVADLSDLTGVLASLNAGRTVALEVDRVVGGSDESVEVDRVVGGSDESVEVDRVVGGSDESVAVELIAAPDDPGRAVIGIGARERIAMDDLPVDITFDSGNIGGPSAGLALTIGIIDLLTPGELTGGKKVAATGTIALDGSVGAIGEVDQKAIAAVRAGVDLLLVPTSNLSEAIDHAGDDMQVVGVASLSEALSALVEE